MTRNDLDNQTSALSGAVTQTLWDLSILEYRANEFKLACEAEEMERPNDAAPSIDWRSDAPAGSDSQAGEACPRPRHSKLPAMMSRRAIRFVRKGYSMPRAAM